MSNNINIPFGLCDITFGDTKLSIQADEAHFEAVPEYTNVFGGALSQTVKYILSDYRVEFTTFLDNENYESLKFHFPVLNEHEHGLFDDASKVDMTGEKLVIHPKYTDSKEFDLTIWNAYISPVHGFNRTFGKTTDKFQVTFIGKPAKSHVNDDKLNNSYFFIGDWSKIGDTNE